MQDESAAVYPSLEGRTVLVTGGASGIGEAIVRGFARQKSRVAFIDIAREAGEALAQELGGRQGDILFLPADLKDIEASRRAVEEARAAFGPVEVLVNNAAHDERHPWREVTPEYWDDRIAVNLRHVFFMTQAVADDMVAANKGSIINFGSVSWMLKQGGMPAYTASKAGIHGMTRSFATDLGKHNIRVNTVVPGWVMTERQMRLWLDAEGERKIDEGQTLAGRVQPHHIASMVLFLAADDSAMCSAQNFIVDGGWV